MTSVNLSLHTTATRIVSVNDMKRKDYVCLTSEDGLRRLGCYNSAIVVGMQALPLLRRGRGGDEVHGAALDAEGV